MTGFGILIAVTLIGNILVPMMSRSYNDEETRLAEDYSATVLALHDGISYIGENPSEEYLKEVNIPENFTIEVESHYVKVFWIYSDKIFKEIMEYQNIDLKECTLKPTEGTYLLRVFYDITLLTIELI